MKVRDLIAALQKMPQDSEVIMWVEPNKHVSKVHWVERRYISDDVYLCDKYWTPYAEEDEE